MIRSPVFAFFAGPAAFFFLAAIAGFLPLSDALYELFNLHPSIWIP
jgi:hypothetical protein